MGTVDPEMEAMLETFIHETETMLEQLDNIRIEPEQVENTGLWCSLQVLYFRLGGYWLNLFKLLYLSNYFIPSFSSPSAL